MSFKKLKRPTVALDFDGVLHTYSQGWKDGTIYDVPVPGSVAAVQALAFDYDLVVFTCRQPLEPIVEWIRENFDLEIPVTNSKPVADIYIDDRGYRFAGDWKKTVADIDTIWDDRWSREDGASDNHLVG